jgi:GAF domain-containing protein
MPAVSSAELSTALDEVQYEAREGPCLDVIRTRGAVEVEEYAHEHRWPAFTARVRETPVDSSLSLPLFVGGDALGALNLYSGAPRGFLTSREDAVIFAEAAASTLTNALAFHRAADLSVQLTAALEHRDVIGQAKGILMAREQIGPDAAFDRLRVQSQGENRKLYEIAEDIVGAAISDARS